MTNMKKDNFSITIGRKSDGFYYKDKDNNMVDVAMIEAFAMLIARLAGTIQHAADKKQNVEYKIEITRTFSKETTSD